MDALILLGQLVCIGALAYGALICFVNAGRYDAQSLQCDVLASRAVRARGHAETETAISECPVDLRHSMIAPSLATGASNISMM
jgi:hypothetical protein